MAETFYKGEEQILYLVVSGVDCPIACLTENSFSEDVEMLDTTTTDNAGWRTSRPLNQGYTISFSGIQIETENDLTPDKYSLDLLRVFKRNRTLINWKIATGTTFVETGSGYITDLQENAPVGEYLSFSGTIEGYHSPLNIQSGALFFLDGSISGNYFQDVTGNGRHFLITNKDFPDDWDKGFPYKSFATISAPIGDATLIAADINNFLYDSGGSPNEIPVVSLFQNIDYEDKLFCKHTEQVLDTLTGIETQEPFVSDIVLYNTVKTGNDLTKCQSYFGVPTEDTGALTVSDGDTLQTAVNAATSGQTIYVKTGDYAGTYFNSKNVTVKGIGYARLSGTGYFNTNIGDNTITIEGMVTSASASYSFYQISTGVANVTINRCLLQGTSMWYRTNTTIDTNVINIKNSLLKNSTNCLSSGEITLDTCRCESSSSTTAYFSVYSPEQKTVKHSILPDNTGTGIINSATLDINFDIFDSEYSGNTLVDKTGVYNINMNLTYNKVNLKTKIFLSNLNSTGTITYNINNNTFIPVGTVATVINIKGDIDISFNNNQMNDGTQLYTYYFEGTTDTSVIEVLNNNFIDSSTYLRNYNCDATIQNNVFYGNTTRVSNTVTITGVTSVVDVLNNTFASKTSENSVISIGTEGTSVSYGKLNGSTVKNNKVLCPRYFGNEPLSQHGVFIYSQTVSVTQNYVNGTFLAFVIKHAGASGYNTVCSYNIIKNCSSGFTIKGSPTTDVYNNLFVNNQLDNSLNSASFLQLLADELYAGSYSINCNFYNNISASYDNYDGSFLTIYQVDNLVGCTFDNNIYYKNNAGTKFAVYVATNKTFAEWQVLGYDANSVTTNPLLDNFIPLEGSPAIDNGYDLGATYNEGLDWTTDWGKDTVKPLIVTKDQSGSWDIGAYVTN